MQIRMVNAADGMLLKRMRLRALDDAPYAFGGEETLVQERALPDEHWHTLARELGGEVKAWRDRCATWFILGDGGGDDVQAQGSSFLCDRVAGRAYFSAAWVDPRYRRRGLGRHLVREALAWAAARGCDHLKLWVDDTNPGAASFYRAMGFIPTGEVRPVSATSSDRESSFELRLSR